MKRALLIFFLLVIGNFLSAHEFWLQPEQFFYDLGEPVNIRLNVGENFEGENWTGDTSKIRSLDFYYGDIKDDLTPAMGYEKGDSIQLSVMDEGTAMVTYNSKNSFLHLDAEKFNAYLLEDGLSDAVAYRQLNNETDSSSYEYYQRSVKTIFQVGSELTNTFQQPTTLPLDIILQQNPYAVKDSQLLTVKINFQQQPLKNTLINIWNRKNSQTTKFMMTSDENGELSFMTHRSGEWMMSCVKMVRTPSANGASQWHSYWGSCTWGYY